MYGGISFLGVDVRRVAHCVFSTPRTRTTTGFLPNRDLFDGHRSVGRLAHVVDREGSYGHRHERFHFDARAIDRVDTGFNVDMGVGDGEVDVDVSHEHWMRHGEEPVSYTHLRAHETGRQLVCR